METYQLKTRFKKLLADTTTPVSIYLRLRDVFPNSLLLESSDYHSRENSMSYVCCSPIAGISLNEKQLNMYFPDGQKRSKPADAVNLREEVSNFRRSFAADNLDDFKFITNGLFGYFTFDTVAHFEDITLKTPIDEARNIPFLQYHVYRYVIAIDHFRNELYVFEHYLGEPEEDGLSKIQYLIQNKNFPEYKFELNGEERSNKTDEEYKSLVEKTKEHIFRGDVFQIVPSRAFSRPFLGDEFNVYRSLRSVNPSPYLFYFDYGNFKLFGSSPEAQLTIKGNEASIYPIAGTFKRTGNTIEDLRVAEALKNDPKESAEHVMLVDLARNDLSRHCIDVEVRSFKEAQFYSHVIHLVSKVSGTLQDGANPFDVVGDTFPAGTLSGAPKHMAMQLIDRYEKQQRGFYSGAIGFMGFNGDFNHAIMIRTFLSKNNRLHYQAGGGVVADSSAEGELNEVNNKIAALRKALTLAEEL
ncbi:MULTISPECIES: anthranilate synthase component I family protein [Olivibacter]|uniref:Anthranilate synthase component 1 n=2 Tax=Olivibacter TaxID=376469 RepID=A0ABV6HI45_9SPHI|nr:MULTISPECIES: anthranilate synthase component I family protein [Olivibacter]MCL4638792.1 anthranilate synthase component I family protein [Olivibacter sp. UJ_SKK_5.1]MDM8177643.1 anthranilate synthase component I family protein [Olivibacter sp. 47]MDX3912362.1 anthranilate synthase component I family protein [Pseudosphingobacterium sp.]QEL00084.1 anthranilate synthase component I family protein [Olivibacter sp. LS-1]